MWQIVQTILILFVQSLLDAGRDLPCGVAGLVCKGEHAL